MSEKNTPAFYAIISADVRYDNSLKPNAKLLYGEITALCNDTGYCWAGNEYFAKLYNVSLNTIRGWITALVEKGYINRQLIYNDQTKEVKTRILSLPLLTNTLPYKKEVPPYKKIYTSPEKNGEGGENQNFGGMGENAESESILEVSDGKENTPKSDTLPIKKRVPPPLKKDRPLPTKKEGAPYKKREENITYEYNTININSIGEKKLNASAFNFLETPEKTKEKNKKFIPPTVEEIADYCKERNNNVDAQRFHDFYSSKGWYVGKNKMKDWKAAVRTWEQSQRRGSSSVIQKPLTISFTPPNEVKPQKYGGF